MPTRLVIKMGGGLISDKSSMKKFEPEAVRRVVDALSSASEMGVSIILVHGAGSFGHLLAKKWGIAGGVESGISERQREAVSEIRSDMRELNGLVVEEFEVLGMKCSSYPPSKWATGTGPSFKGDVSIFDVDTGEPTPVTFGDVVDTDDPREFGILSGDDLMLRISSELEVSHCIFLIGDAEGALSGPPDEDGSKLIEELRSPSQIKGKHQADIDVTGGISLKVERALEISKKVGEVWIIDGRKPERILELLTSGKTTGTKIWHG
tara:strand:- start:2421 stop:3215 length:795 start_codon:yes stop_codon:yes gene_type:complete